MSDYDNIFKILNNHNPEKEEWRVSYNILDDDVTDSKIIDIMNEKIGLVFDKKGKFKYIFNYKS